MSTLHPSSRFVLSLGLAVAIVAVAVIRSRPVAMAIDASVTTPSAVAVNDPAGWQAAVRQGILAGEYEISPAVGGWQAPNRRQNFRVTFQDRDVALTPRIGDVSVWSWRWSTLAWGRGSRLRAPAPARLITGGTRITFVRDDLSEWYENRPDGLEQGFTITAAPTGDGPLCIEGAVASGLTALPSADGDRIDFLNDDGVAVLSYGGLVVCDADERALPAAMVATAGGIRLEIDDRGARLPIVVDPLMNSPAWTAECNVANAQFGFAIATAGDVNGDGFSDALVGAPGYDNGAAESPGRTFVYIGSASGLGAAAAWSARPGILNGLGKFGQSVACAGDVNGDGYGDILIGAPELADDAHTSEGHTYSWYGGPAGGAGGSSGLGANGTATNADWEADGDQTQALLGQAVASAGDVNSDGYDDIVIGAPGYDSDEGEIFVWLGSAGGLGVSGTPANADWRTLWTDANSALGWSVAGAGDVNADGFADILSGCPHGSNGQSGEGGAFLWLGGAGGLGPSGTPLNADWYGESNQAAAEFGTSVAAAGDVDGDGYADVIIGAPSYDNPTAGEGAAFVWLGSPTDLGANGSPANADWTFEGNQNGARLGAAVATAGDVNGDGFADVVVGAPGYDGGQADEGRALVFLGSGSGLATVAVWSTESNQVTAQYGAAVACAGDVNGDGFGDVLVGAYLFDNPQPNEGRVFAYHGYGGGLAAVHGWIQESNQAEAKFGWSVAGAGDVNGDGYSDFIVGAPWYDNGQSDEGRVFVYAGQPISPTVNPIWTAECNQASAHFGQTVAGAGDVNGDGYDDVIVGAPDYENAAGEDGEGGAFLWFGSAAGLGASGTPSNADWSADSDQAQASFGWSVARAGDANGDGFGDVIVGAPYWDEPDPNGGKVFVFYGSVAGPSVAADWTWVQTKTVASLGYSVAGAGDIDGDGFSDIIVGAPLYSDEQPLEGRAWVFRGHPTGLSLSPSWFLNMDQAGADLGLSVASAGDVNGDGFADVILGAWAYDGDAGSATGLALVYLGSSSGLAAHPDWRGEGSQPDTYFGASVASAGDVNGDGFSDVIVGGYGYTNGQAEEGGAWVYHGSAAGLAELPAWSVEGGQVDAHLGRAVASAGDVTGDGFADVLVGLPDYDAPASSEGRVLLFYGNGGNGMDRAARQIRADDSAPIALLGRANTDQSFRLKVRGRSAAGRDRVRTEWEVKPLGTVFDGTGVASGSDSDTGVPGTQGSVVDLDGLVSSLAADLPYHWRLRTRSNSPLFPRSPWLTMAGNGRNETDLRTSGGLVAVDDGSVHASATILAHASPNPFNAHIQITYTLRAASRVDVRIYDLRGRVVARLADGILPEGTHTVTWDGTDETKRAAASGIYFARIDANEGSWCEKIALVR